MAKKPVFKESDYPTTPAAVVATPEVETIYKERMGRLGKEVILGRAIPAIEDGLLPVARRSLYSFYEQGDLTKYKKAALFVGATLGKYHAHGDASVYDAMVNLSQWFKKLNPLLESEGNNGNINGDPAAAMRYLELRMSKASQDFFFKDFDKSIVDMQDNYDNTLKEPSHFPSIFPSILNVATTGIGVGYACTMLPHRVEDICMITKRYIGNPNILSNELYKDFRPDFPTGGTIINQASLPKFYDEGKGTVYVDARIEIVEFEGKEALVVTELPYLVTIAGVVSKIRELSVPLAQTKGSSTKTKNVFEDDIYDIRDLSDARKGQPVYLVIIPKNGVSPSVLMAKLYKHTRLRDFFGYNANVLHKGELCPSISVREIISRWLESRYRFLARKFTSVINRASYQKSLKLAFIKVHKDLQAFIKLIEGAKGEQDAIEKVRDRYDMTEIEARYVVNLKIYQISKAEIATIEEEVKKLEAQIKLHVGLLASKDKMNEYIVKELDELATKYAKPRQTALADTYSSNDDARALVEEEELMVGISSDNYIYAKPIDSLRQYKGRGVVGSNFIDSRYKKSLRNIITVNSHDELLCFTSGGKVFKAKGYEFNLWHKHVGNILPHLNGEDIVNVVKYDASKPNDTLLFLSRDSNMKRVEMSEFANVNIKGIIALRLKEGDALVDVKYIQNDEDIIIVATKHGKAQRLQAKLIDINKRPTSGFPKLILKDGDYCVALEVLSKESDDAKILFITEEGLGKAIAASDLPLRSKASQRGATFVAIKFKSKEDGLVGCHFLPDDGNVVVTTTSNKVVKISSSEINQYGRQAKGNRIITLNEGDKVSNFYCE